MTDSVPELAEEISPSDDPPAMSMRVGIITALEVGGSRRVQVDIAADTWLNRLQDTSLKVNDRVSVLQQGPLMLVIGRLEGTDGFVPIGVVLPWAGWFEPTNWMNCDGRTLSRSLYPDLFFVCGTAFGVGNGTTTFNIPDLRGKFPQGEGGAVGTLRGSIGGANSITLSTNQMPSHNHSLSGSADSAGSHGHSLSGSVGSGGGHSHSVGNQGGRSDLLAGGGTSAATSGGGSTGSDGDHSHSMSGSADSGGSHSHTLSGSVGANGSGASIGITNPFVTVGYIIRVL